MKPQSKPIFITPDGRKWVVVYGDPANDTEFVVCLDVTSGYVSHKAVQARRDLARSGTYYNRERRA